MNLTIPIDVLAILDHLQKAGHKAYIVGGSVRDLLLGKQPTDWDFTTDATPEQIQVLFPESFYENEFGTVAISRNHVREQFNLMLPTNQPQPKADEPMAQTDQLTKQQHKVIDLDSATKIHASLSDQRSVISDQEMDREQLTSDLQPQTSDLFEITTFRSDGVYKDNRRPETVTWGKTVEEDLARRDFTINAMAIAINSKSQIPNSNTFETLNLTPDIYSLIDPYHGTTDLDNKIVQTVGDPHQRFQEDALRMLRAVRISVQLGFTIQDETLQAITQHVNLIKNISWERIRDEFLKILSSDSPVPGILQLEKVGLLSLILPEILEGKGVKQGGHHISNVWEHSLSALEHCPSSDPIVRFATLLHDVAKPRTQNINGKNITFYNHEIVGARMAKAIAQRFKLSKRDIDRMYLLVRYHMFYYQPENTDASIRRFMRKVGLKNINDIIDLRIADRLGSGSRETSWRFEEMKKRMQEQLHQPFDINDLAIDGNDIMKEFNLQPGRKIGEILQALFEEVLETPELNEREKLLTRANELI